MTDTKTTLAVCGGGAVMGLLVSGGNPLGAVGGCLATSLVAGSTGCSGPSDENSIPRREDGGSKYEDVYISPDTFVEEDRFADTVMATELWKVQPLAERLTANAQSEEEAVVAVTQWAENNFFHYADFGNGEVYSPNIYGEDNDFESSFNSISIEDIFRERAVGCHFASGVIITMLRSLGIAADYVRSEGHGVTYLPSLDRYIHGDHVAGLVCIPAEEFLQNREELDYWAQHPGFSTKRDGQMTIVSPGYLAFQRMLKEEYGLWLELQRTGNTLHVFGYISRGGSENFESLVDICSEYNLRREGVTIESDFLPIQGIDEL